MAHQTQYLQVKIKFTSHLVFIRWGFIKSEQNHIFISFSLIYKSKEDWYRVKDTYKFYSVWIEMTHKPSEVAAAKMFFSGVYVIDATCFNECVLFHVITGRHYILWKSVLTLGFFQLPYFCFLWNKCFERSPYFILSLQ